MIRESNILSILKDVRTLLAMRMSRKTDLDTNQLTNGANYITLASLSAGAGISYNNTTGVIASTITQ